MIPSDGQNFKRYLPQNQVPHLYRLILIVRGALNSANKSLQNLGWDEELCRQLWRL